MLSRVFKVTMKNLKFMIQKDFIIPLFSLAHPTRILYLHRNVVGKSCLQRPIQGGFPCDRENGIFDIFACHVMFAQIPWSNCKSEQEWTRESLRIVIIWQQWMNVHWMQLTHSLSNFVVNLRAPFYASTLTSKNVIAFLNVHTREN